MTTTDYPRVLRGPEAKAWLRQAASNASHEPPTHADRMAYQRELDDELTNFSRLERFR